RRNRARAAVRFRAGNSRRNAMTQDCRKHLSQLDASLTRRQIMRGLAGSALAYPALSGAGLIAGGGAALAADVETLEITPDLIAAAKKEGQVFLRYSSPVTVYEHHAAAFKEEFGIEVVTDRKVGPVGQQVFAQEERPGKHVM